MCGIAGIVSFQGSARVSACIRSMTDALRHRGPDDEGYVFFGPGNRRVHIYGGQDTPREVYDSRLNYAPTEVFVGQEHHHAFLAFGHRRLSIIDLTATGHQPMCTPDRRYWIIYNGEIYNFLELRVELEKQGYQFESNSDTEVLLNAYVHWGVRAFTRLIGMFAFAVYDNEKGQLLLARDFFGIKPLYYTVWSQGFAFASEIKALLTLPHLNRTLNAQRVYEYLRFGLVDHGEECLLREIRQIPAAHFVTVALEKEVHPQPVRYWRIGLDAESSLSEADAALEIRDVFLESIRLHLRSDVPVGAALSGGIDSSSIVMGVRAVQENLTNFDTFSFIAEGSDVSEERWADLTSREANVKIHKVKLTADELLADLDKLIDIQDEPFGSTSIYAQYRVMGLAKERGVKVMLDGQGADEMLGGYRFFFAARLASLIRQARCLKGFRFLLQLRRYEDVRLLDIVMKTGIFFLPSHLGGYFGKLIGLGPNPAWLRKRWFRDRDVKTEFSEKTKVREVLREQLYRSLMDELLIGLLRYEDRNSMAFSIESRVPFLTPELAGLLYSLPEEYIINAHGTTKAIFRRAMKGIVPSEILERKDKIGFATPEKDWLRHSHHWVESVLGSDTAKKAHFFNVPALEREWKSFLGSHNTRGFSIWRCINFVRWAENRNVSFEL